MPRCDDDAPRASAPGVGGPPADPERAVSTLCSPSLRVPRVRTAHGPRTATRRLRGVIRGRGPPGSVRRTRLAGSTAAVGGLTAAAALPPRSGPGVRGRTQQTVADGEGRGLGAGGGAGLAERMLDVTVRGPRSAGTGGDRRGQEQRLGDGLGSTAAVGPVGPGAVVCRWDVECTQFPVCSALSAIGLALMLVSRP